MASSTIRMAVITMMLAIGEGRRVQDGFQRVVERVGNLVNNPNLQEMAVHVADQTKLLEDMGDASSADDVILNSLESLMKDPHFKVEARRLAFDITSQVADPHFQQQIEGMGQRSMDIMPSETKSKEFSGLLYASLAAPAAAFQAPGRVPKGHFDPLRLQQAGPMQKFMPAAIKANPTTGTAMSALIAAAVAFHAEAAHAGIGGNQGQLDFGALSGDQPGGEGTGKFLGAGDPTFLVVLFGVNLFVRALFYDGAEKDKESTYAWSPDDRSGL